MREGQELLYSLENPNINALNGGKERDAHFLEREKNKQPLAKFSFSYRGK